MNEKDTMQESRQDQIPEEFDLDDIMKEFAPGTGDDPSETGVSEDTAVPEVVFVLDEAGTTDEIGASEETNTAEETGAPEEADDSEAASVFEEAATSEEPEAPAAGDPQPSIEEDVRIELPRSSRQPVSMGDTVRLEDISQLAEEAQPQAAPETPAQAPAEPEAFSGQWQPEYEQPMGEYVPPQPIIFHPRSQLRELKRKLVAGPERRYYEINEIGFGKLQTAIFLSLLVVIMSAGATALYALGMVSAARIKLMVFCQFFAMLVSALLGSYQLMEGIADLLKGRFSLNTMLVFTFAACLADGVICLRQQRIPCCAAFSLQVTMSLWGAYHRRSTEMAMMDTLRKAVNLDGIKRVENYYDGCDGLLREKGEPEDFMEHYRNPSAPDKVVSWYLLAALVVSIGLGVAAGLLHNSLSFGVQVLSVSLLAATPVASFVMLTRPMAILERRLHKVGTVLCGWRGVAGLSRRAVFPVSHEDLFPVGACKLNGVKFYGDRDTDQVVAYCAALVSANGGTLVPLFDYLLSSRNGRHYQVENLRGYNGGIGGEVCGEPVLLGSLNCLKELGVEIPEGTSVSQAVYAAIDGELCGVFAVTYAKIKSASSGLRALCAYRKLRPVVVTDDFMLTEEFLRGRFSANTRRICFPQPDVRNELAAVKPEPDSPALALVTKDGLVSYAYAVTGARSLKTALWTGLAVQLLGGILGLAMMGILAVMGAGELLTPANLFLYELVWIIPGLLITEWTRTV